VKPGTFSKDLSPLLNAQEVTALMREVYPQLGREYSIVDVKPGYCLARLEADERHLRPGDTVSGPTLFTLADIGGYGCALSHIGPEALAVTVNLNINFMRKAGPGLVEAECSILKLGKNLLVFDAALYWRKDNALVAHATGTYSLPKNKNREVK